MIGVIDSSVYQVPGGRQDSNPTVTGRPATISVPADTRLDLSLAATAGVVGVFHRAANGVTADPSMPIVAAAARAAGLRVGAYAYLRPNEPGTARAHADQFLRVAGGCDLPAMADVEDFHGAAQETWRGDRYADWLAEWLEVVEVATGRRPIIYTFRWFWSAQLQHRVGDFADHELVIANYPHQPDATTRQHLWPRPPVAAADWDQWARGAVPMLDGTLDAGAPSGPGVADGFPTWAMWQFSSFGRAQDYGFGAANLDLDLVRDDVWSRWTAAPASGAESPPPLATPTPVQPPKETPVTLYPVGYGTQLASLDKCLAETAAHHHPEFVRRLRAWLIAQQGRIGIGDAWRATGTQPAKPGFAPEGRSFHQDQRFMDGFRGGCAVDLVARRAGGKHRSPTWSEVPRQGSALARQWGLHANVSSEPWHMQPVEVDGYDSWLRAGRPAPEKGYPLPVAKTPENAGKTPGGSYMVDASRSTVRENDQGKMVARAQSACQLITGAPATVDGQFGGQTKTAVENFQRFFKLDPDGVVGPKTWAVLEQITND